MSEAASFHEFATCRRKIRYSDPILAFRHYVEMAAAGDVNLKLHVYECQVCGGLHLGKPRALNAHRRIKNDLRKGIIGKLLASKIRYSTVEP